MAIAKSTEISKIEVVNTWTIGVRTDTVVKEDGVEIGRTTHRKLIDPFTSGKDGSDWVHAATDISGEDASVQAICNAAWTNTVKNNYKTWAEANLEQV